MSIQSCAEVIARIQYERKLHPSTTEPPKTPFSYRYDRIAGRRFCVAVAPSDVVIVHVETLPPIDRTGLARGSGTRSLGYSCLKPSGHRKEPADRNYQSHGKDTVPRPMERKDWFLGGEVRRIITEANLRRYAELFLVEKNEKILHPRPLSRAEKILRRRRATKKELSWKPSVRKTISLSARVDEDGVEYPVEDTGPHPILDFESVDRRVLGPFVRRNFSRLAPYKLNRQLQQLQKEMAAVKVMSKQGFSQREIAERLGQSRGWVRHRLEMFAKEIARTQQVSDSQQPS